MLKLPTADGVREKNSQRGVCVVVCDVCGVVLSQKSSLLACAHCDLKRQAITRALSCDQNKDCWLSGFEIFFPAFDLIEILN